VLNRKRLVATRNARLGLRATPPATSEIDRVTAAAAAQHH
jgi:hypothetical protein